MKNVILIVFILLIMIIGVWIAYAQVPQEYIRIRIDIAIPKATWEGWTQVQRDAVKDRLLQIKAVGKKINEGKINEENTISVKWHICRHELGLPCGEEKDF